MIWISTHLRADSVTYLSFEIFDFDSRKFKVYSLENLFHVSSLALNSDCDYCLTKIKAILSNLVPFYSGLYFLLLWNSVQTWIYERATNLADLFIW